jgi:hypothetical protein
MSEIIVKSTDKISNNEWKSYVDSFNKVFNKKVSINEFKYKYLNTIDGLSYHSFLYDKTKITGAFTLIPYEYLFDDEAKRIGLAVDVFICEAFRNDPMLIYKMYKKLVSYVKEFRLQLNIGVPNDMAYPYWKKILKWKDIGNIPYYALPIKAGKIIKRFPSIFNLLNKLYLKIVFSSTSTPNRVSAPRHIRINRELDIVEQQRYTNEYKKVKTQECFFSYRIVDEKGIQTCYLIDFYGLSNNMKEYRTIKHALKYILRTENVDLILYVGNIYFKQRFLIRIPFKYEPKHLFFTCDILEPSSISENLILKHANWEFGLFNYDAR